MSVTTPVKVLLNFNDPELDLDERDYEVQILLELIYKVNLKPLGDAS